MIAGGEPFSGLVLDEFVMEIERFRVFEKDLQETVHVGGRKEVLASGDEGNALLGIIHHYCEMVGGGDIPAGEDDIAELPRHHGPGSTVEIVEGELSAALRCTGGVEPPGVGFSVGDPGGPLVVAEATAGPGVEGTFRSVGSVGHAGDLVFDGAPVTEAGINHLTVAEAIEGTGIVLQPV